MSTVKAMQLSGQPAKSANDKKCPSILLDLSPGVESTITGINTKDTRVLKKMMAMGILPGMAVEIIQKYPSVVFKVGNTILAVDNNIAGCIEVQN
ncbi:MAG: ferrous iron transport protein A [Firmicutes bacterium]|nr:ferrous iron transport protein A [Bacillota bacterium]